MERFTSLSGVISFFLLFIIFFVNNASPDSPLTIEDLPIEDKCGPGEGVAKGEIEIIERKVVLARPKISHRCWAKENSPIFFQDSIFTGEKARMRFYFEDGSKVTLHYKTNLEVTQNIYEEAAKKRELHILMGSGKVRFSIKKLPDFKDSKVRVKTKWVLVIVKASDFIVEVTEKFTKITALDDTILEVISLADLKAEPTVVSEFQQTVVEEGKLPSEVETLSKKEIDDMKNDFKFSKLQEPSKGKYPIGILVPPYKLIPPDDEPEPYKPDNSEFPGIGASDPIIPEPIHPPQFPMPPITRR